MMTRPCPPVLILFAIIGILLVSGCVSEVPKENKIPETTPVTTPMPTPCSLPPQGAEPYIIINPIGTHSTGDIFEVNGTTNLGVDSKIVLNIHEQLMSSLPANYYPLSYSFGCVTIQKNTCGPNFWSYSVNVSGYHPRKYWAQIWDESNYTATYNTTNFLVYRDEAEIIVRENGGIANRNNRTPAQKIPYEIRDILNPNFTKDYKNLSKKGLYPSTYFVPSENASQKFTISEITAREHGGEIKVHMGFEPSASLDIIDPFVTQIYFKNEEWHSAGAWVGLNNLEKIASLPEVVEIFVLYPAVPDYSNEPGLNLSEAEIKLTLIPTS
jgi:hypothetical protein